MLPSGVGPRGGGGGGTGGLGLAVAKGAPQLGHTFAEVLISCPHSKHFVRAIFESSDSVR